MYDLNGNLVTDVFSAAAAALEPEIDTSLFHSIKSSEEEDDSDVVIDESLSFFPVDKHTGMDYATRVAMVKGFLGDALPTVELPPRKRRKLIGSCGHNEIAEPPR
jgi:hypothetical protein